MTIDEYRRIALAQPETVESSHMDHPDFRVRNKIFATICSNEGNEGALKLTPDQQKQFIAEHPKVFRPAAGTWGRTGSTIVQLRLATKEVVNRAMRCAWRNTAPKSLITQVGHCRYKNKSPTSSCLLLVKILRPKAAFYKISARRNGMSEEETNRDDLSPPKNWTPPPLHEREIEHAWNIPPAPKRKIWWPVILITLLIVLSICGANWKKWNSRFSAATQQSSVTGTASATASPTNAPVVIQETVSQSAKAIPFHGLISKLDVSGKTFVIGENEHALALRISDRTNVTKNDRPTTINDLRVNDEVRGSYWKEADGTFEAKTVRANSLTNDAPPATPGIQDIRHADLQKLAYEEATRIMRKNWPQETPTQFKAELFFGDVTGDADEEAVVIIRYRFSGEASTSVFSHVLVYGLRNGAPTLLAILEGGDRAHGGVERVRIENHELFLNRYRPATEASCMACYDFMETTEYRWEADKFISQNVSLKKLEKRQPAEPASINNESFRSGKQYPNATWSGTAGFVTSPYPPHNLIDVRGFSSGQYVRDPSTGKIFCVPP